MAESVHIVVNVHSQCNVPKPNNNSYKFRSKNEAKTISIQQTLFMETGELSRMRSALYSKSS